MTEVEKLRKWKFEATRTLNDCLKYMNLAIDHGKFHRDHIGDLEAMKGRILLRVEQLNELNQEKTI